MAKLNMSAGKVAEADYHQKDSELRSKVEKIYRDLTQRYNHSRKVNLLEDVPVNQESHGNLVDAIEEEIPSNKTGHKEYQKRQATG
jgi:hypothetical protein